jgi:HEAT repeat protein
MRVRYLESGPSGRVHLVVDETRQRELSGTVDDDQIRRLLLAAARESSDAGLRAESMDVLKAERTAGELRPVLLYALQHDSNPGVRLKALDALKAYGGEADVRAVLTQVLLTDDNPGVRAQAIDLLVEHKGGMTAGVLQEVVQKENNSYVRLRCQRALEDMNASVGTF